MRIAATSYSVGEGVPIVLLHAFPIDHRVWDNCAANLIVWARGQGFEPFDIIAPDMPGAGESPAPSPVESGEKAPDGAYTQAMDLMAEAICDKLKASGRPRALFVGISMGAYLALAIHRLHPDMVAGLVICDSKAAGDGPEARADRIRIARECLDKSTVAPVMHFAEPHVGDSAFKHSPEFVDTFTRWINEQTPAGVAWRELMAAGRRDESDQLAALTVPVGLISGQRDPSSGPEAMRALIPQITQVTPDFTVIEDAGHFSCFERPAQVAAAIMTTYRKVVDNEVRLHPHGADVDAAKDIDGNGENDTKATESPTPLGLSPIALMRQLDDLPLARDIVDDRTYDCARDGFLDETLADPATQVFLISHGFVAAPRGASLAPRLALLPAQYLRKALGGAPGALAMAMGSHTVAGRTTNYVAIDISRALSFIPNAVHVSADNDFGEAPDALAADSLFTQRAANRFDWYDLRDFTPVAPALDAGLATRAVSLAAWHASQRFCPCCGSPVEPVQSGWAQRCTNAADGRRTLFPRIEPCVITMVVDPHDRIMIQHNVRFPGNLYSVCAGFVDAGESLEHAVRRECLEETGVQVGQLRYLGSQPWPFPASLMMGFAGIAQTSDIHVDGVEVADARWVSRDELADLISKDEVSLPGRAAIARYMISQWYGKEL